MEIKPYYTAYEERYQKAYEAGAERWGHSPDDHDLKSALAVWVEKYHLTSKRVIEFACGEGAGGVILSELGCLYHGIDIAPSALEKARIALSQFPDAKVSLLDMARQQVDEVYDAAVDVMGYHMLITDLDRADYLKNAFTCPRSGAPMLFFDEAYRDEDVFDGVVELIDQWITIHNLDLVTPQKRTARSKGGEIDVEVSVPLLAARPRSRKGYADEMEKAGFILDDFIVMESNEHITSSASIYVHKLQAILHSQKWRRGEAPYTNLPLPQFHGGGARGEGYGSRLIWARKVFAYSYLRASIGLSFAARFAG